MDGLHANEVQDWNTFMKIKIFYIDDERTNTLLFFRQFEKKFDVSVFNNYEDFCAGLVNETPDVFVLDLMMPDVSGFELTSYIRSTHRLKFIPIMILTAMEKNENLEKCFKNGADDFMRKPAKYPELEVRLESLAMQGKFREEHITNRKIDSMQLMINGFNHEFNNHLTILHSGVEVLELSLTEQKQLKKTQMLLKTITRASHLLKDISKLYNSEKKIISSQGILKIIESFQAHMTTDLEFGEVSIEFNLNSEDHRVEMSGSNVQVVLKAFISNAIDAYYNMGDDRKKQIKVELSSSDSFVIIKVMDRGRGIPQADLSKVFDPFFTTKGALGGEMIAGRRSGTGLGLSLAEVLVSNAGGVIKFLSTVGRGTDVILAIPIAKYGSSFEDAKGSFKLLKKDRSNLQIKVIDSNETGALLLKHYLFLQSYKTEINLQLESSLEGDHYDVLLLKNSFDWSELSLVLRKIREEKGRDFPIFLLGSEEELGAHLDFLIEHNIAVLIFEDNLHKISEAISSISIYYNIS
ncbi:MAG: hypothetical protein COB02_00095 [Candidatus Cloacimonadota bacterium]|nr:MAG: hypothetical protein COB02_04230 [Candidatus Cloacimonadota bacterium]PCJ21023.1 MAG: hypothetical protein COB02_00095 [Candidatus Cloacimonadota bacterium]